jgi:hypothetical protein
MPGPTVADLEHGGPGPDDLLDQNDRIVAGAGAARGQQTGAAGAVAERQAAGRPGRRGAGGVPEGPNALESSG